MAARQVAMLPQCREAMARVLRSRLLIAAIALAVVASPLGLAAADSVAHPSTPSTDTNDWDDFSDDFPAADPLLSPSSWVPLLDPASPSASDDGPVSTDDVLFVEGARAMLSAASAGDHEAFSMAANQIEAAAEEGHPGALSALAFLSGAGMTRPASRSRALLLHKMAADAGDLQSKMALAYSYFRQEMYEEAVTLYAESAKAALRSSLTSKVLPVVERFKIHSGTKQNEETLMKSRAEDDGDIQITEYQAQQGNASAMYKLGIIYYYGLRGLRHDYEKSFHWFSKAVENDDTRSMEYLGEIYTRGAGVERNYTEAYKWLTLAAKQQHYSAYNGLGYLYVKGYGVEKKNLTKAREFFELAAENKESEGHFYLGLLYLKGMGVKRDVIRACNFFLNAVNSGQENAIYQVAKLFQKGIGLKRNLYMTVFPEHFSVPFIPDPSAQIEFGCSGANIQFHPSDRDLRAPCSFHNPTCATLNIPSRCLSLFWKYLEGTIDHDQTDGIAAILYRAVAERGPLASLSRWAVESYLKGDVGKAFLLYSRMAELGYEVAQSNAAWILDRYNEQSICIGESGFCTDTERHLRAHAYWWQASEQGNEDAAFLIGDAYYYGGGVHYSPLACKNTYPW